MEVLCTIPVRSFTDITYFDKINDNHKPTKIVFRQIKQWMNVNKLVINSKKSQACIVDHKLHSFYAYHFDLKYCNHAILISDKTKYLGAELDAKPNFLRHLKTLEAKLSRNVGILFKLNKIVPTSALVTLCFALIHPFLSYDVILLGACNKSSNQIKSSLYSP